ncbi:MAG TPA: S9 family peptidase [Bryobacteraceae bacterium]|nr:S9 family peptidase [Bryobacteraceae bacterium]
MRTTLLFLAACGLLVAQGHRLTLEDLLSAEPIGETALSPDGKTFAMTRGGQIVLMPSEGGWPVTLTSNAGGKSGLSWSPNGRTIAYASQGNIWAVPVAGGTPRRLTTSAAGPGDPRQSADRAPQWSPKGHWILFETGRRGHNNMMVVSEDGLSNNFVTGANADEDGANWSPDGSAISYTQRTREYFSGKLNVVKFDAAKGQAAGDPVSLYTSPTDRGGGWSIRKANWSPDGRTLAVVLQDSGWDGIYLIPASGGTPKALTHGEYEDVNPVFSPNGKALAIVSTRKNLQQSDIWVVPVDGAAPRMLAKFDVPGMESQPEWSPDGNRIYFHRTTPLESNDLLVAEVSGGSAKYLTHTTPRNFDGALKVPDEIHYRGKDGIDVAAILYKPHEYKAGTKYPAVLWIHGGPEGQDTFRLDVWAQYLAQSGYVVLEPNYRGSTGYGEKFRNLNVEDSGGGEMDDVAAGAEYLINQGLADPKRVAIGGGSHGGTMVAYAVTKYPDLFAAAIELYGVVDRATFLERTNRNTAIRWAMKMGGTPEEKPEVYRKANALLQIDKIRTPLLVMHGENDPQVPPYESAQFVRALKEHGKTVYYYTYPNELHGFAQRDHRLDAWRRQLAFLEKYVQPRFGQSSTSVDDLLGPPAPASNRESR